MRLVTILLATSLVACRDKAEDTEAVDTADRGVELDGDGDGYLVSDGDCNDDDASVSPAGVEVCDGIDNNCDGDTDEGVTSTFYRDADTDGFGDVDQATDACDQPSGYVSIPNDCDDGDATTYPGASERCDSADNDCDGEIDEDVREIWYVDADQDGYGDADTVTEECDPPDRYVADDTDCDDLDPASNPGAAEICDEADNNCDGTVDEGVTTTFDQDADGDNYGDAALTTEACARPNGYAAMSGDCDEADDDVNPSATELCDGADNDCDGATDEADAADAATWYADADSDGYGSSTSAVACDQPSGYVGNDDDCDDSTASVSPGEAEVCDSADNDCDGDVDEDSATDAVAWYADADGDGYGSSVSTVACDQPSGYAAVSGDCDDGEASASPGEAEVCDEIDNDCDGSTDEGLTSSYYLDYDGDGYGDSGRSTAGCSAPSGYVSDSSDCDDSDSSANPGAPEVCDSVDNNCDGTADEGVTTTYYLDGDSDGYGSASTTTEACSAPASYVTDATDCDDGDSSANPDAEEVCDEVDNDCDGDTDEGLTSSYYPDDDGDSYGDPDAPLDACAQPSGYVTDDSDCDDGDAGINPDAEEVCDDGVDNDCSGDADDGTLGDGETCPAYDCADILADDATAASGVYWIDPSGSDAYEVYCDMSTQSGGWTLLGVYTNNDSSSWSAYSSHWYSDTSTMGAPTSPSTNADAKSQAFNDLPVDELMIMEYPSSVDIVTATSCIGSRPLVEIFQRSSENDADCAYSCSTVTRSAPWSGQSYQDSTLRFRCMDNDGYSSAGGYTLGTDDNSMITTLNNGSYHDYNFGLGAGYGTSTQAVDWDQTTSDAGDSSSSTQILLLGR